MTTWVVRGGDDGQHEAGFIRTGAIHLTWERLDVDLTALTSRAAIGSLLRGRSDRSPESLAHYVGMAHAFVNEMREGDVVVLPRKRSDVVRIGQLTGPYEYDAKRDPAFRHRREVAWDAADTPLSALGQEQVAAIRNTPRQNFKLAGGDPRQAGT